MEHSVIPTKEHYPPYRDKGDPNDLCPRQCQDQQTYTKINKLIQRSTDQYRKQQIKREISNSIIHPRQTISWH